MHVLFFAAYEYMKNIVRPFHPLIVLGIVAIIIGAFFFWNGGHGALFGNGAQPLTVEEKMVIVGTLSNDSRVLTAGEKAAMVNAVATESMGPDASASESAVAAKNSDKLQILQSLDK